MMTSAIQNRGTDVMTNAKSADTLSITLYWRGATTMPMPTPKKVDIACAMSANNSVRGNRSAINSPTSLR